MGKKKPVDNSGKLADYVQKLRDVYGLKVTNGVKPRNSRPTLKGRELSLGTPIVQSAGVYWTASFYTGTQV